VSGSNGRCSSIIRQLPFGQRPRSHERPRRHVVVVKALRQVNYHLQNALKHSRGVENGIAVLYLLAIESQDPRRLYKSTAAVIASRQRDTIRALGSREPRSPASSVLSKHYDFLNRIRGRL
jgi:hypothetical protein